MNEKLDILSISQEEKKENREKSYKKVPRLSEKELSIIDNLDFLQTSIKYRLQYISQNNIKVNDILNGKVKNIEIDFHGNKNLYSMTTAGQIMPNEVRNIIAGGQKWTRSENSLSGEFFNQNNIRLIIGEGINSEFKGYKNLEIGNLATPEELQEITEKKSQELDKYLKENNLDKNYENIDILKASINRGIDPKLAIKYILPLVDDLGNEERSAKIEYIITGFERTRGKFNIPENQLNDFMKNYFIENKIENYISKNKVTELVLKYFPEGVNINHALEIIGKESRFDANNIRPFYKNSGGGNDLGLFQINDYYQRENIAKLGYTPNDMFDVNKNIRIAALAYKEAGNSWHPWIAARKLGIA